MKYTLSTFVPFQHNNLGYIQTVINIARSQDNSNLQGALTSTLIYINAVDYISFHLLDNLIEMDSLITNHHLNGVFYRNDKGPNSMPLHRIIEELEKYSFPLKEDFVENLKNFQKVRNPITHNLLSLRQEQINSGEADNFILNIKTIAEQLLDQYDTIVRGVLDEWNIHLGKISATQSLNLP